MSGPLSREERSDNKTGTETEEGSELEDINWEREHKLEVGSRQDPEPAKTASDQRQS